MRSISAALATAVAATMAVSAAAGQEVKPPPSPYAGSEVCGTCHEDTAKAFERNPHHAVETDKHRGWEGKACESCHGPALKHTESATPEDIRNPSDRKAFERNPHHAVETDKHRGWEGKACESCHGPALKHTESATPEDIRNP